MRRLTENYVHFSTCFPNIPIYILNTLILDDDSNRKHVQEDDQEQQVEQDEESEQAPEEEEEEEEESPQAGGASADGAAVEEEEEPAEPEAAAAVQPVYSMEGLDLGKVIPKLIKHAMVFGMGTWLSGKLSPAVEGQVRAARVIYTAYLIFSQALCMYIRFGHGLAKTCSRMCLFCSITLDRHFVQFR